MQYWLPPPVFFPLLVRCCDSWLTFCLQSQWQLGPRLGSPFTYQDWCPINLWEAGAGALFTEDPCGSAELLWLAVLSVCASLMIHHMLDFQEPPKHFSNLRKGPFIQQQQNMLYVRVLIPPEGISSASLPRPALPCPHNTTQGRGVLLWQTDLAVEITDS